MTFEVQVLLGLFVIYVITERLLEKRYFKKEDDDKKAQGKDKK